MQTGSRSAHRQRGGPWTARRSGRFQRANFRAAVQDPVLHYPWAEVSQCSGIRSGSRLRCFKGIPIRPARPREAEKSCLGTSPVIVESDYNHYMNAARVKGKETISSLTASILIVSCISSLAASAQWSASPSSGGLEHDGKLGA